VQSKTGCAKTFVDAVGLGPRHDAGPMKLEALLHQHRYV
jgi:hypothetical protein